MNDSDVGLQPPLLHVSLVTERARILGIVVNLAFDSLVNVLLVCFQTVESGKVISTDLTRDDDTAIVNLQMNLVRTARSEAFTTDLTGVSVFGLALMFNGDMSIEKLFGFVNLPTLTTLE